MAVLKRRPLGIGILLAAVFCTATVAEQRTSSGEDDIKATFLFNFTKFVEWPSPPAAEPFRLCVVAEPAFGASVDRIVAGEAAQGRPIVRVTPATPDAARNCEMLFIGRNEADRVDRWIAAVRSMPVLVVGESRGFCEHGGHINFVVEDNHVRFDVNRDAASRAGLTISSKLLRIARQVLSRRQP